MLKTKLFSERLKEMREEKNLSVKELGESCGTSGATISRYETGVHEPKSNMVKKLAEFFNVNPAWLMGANIDRNESMNTDEDIAYIKVAMDAKRANISPEKLAALIELLSKE